MNEKRTYYFAYGSNCNIQQMDFRCPRAKDLGAVTLHGYQLEFRRVASIRPQEGASTSGVLWAITAECEKVLDKYEGFPRFYTKEAVTVTTENGDQIKAMVYVMIPMEGREIAPPDSGYHDGILTGLKAHGISTRKFYNAVQESKDLDGEMFAPSTAQKQPYSRSGRKLKLTEERTTIRTYIDNSTLEAVDEYVHQRKKEEKGYSRSDCINKALADFLAKEKEEESDE